MCIDIKEDKKNQIKQLHLRQGGYEAIGICPRGHAVCSFTH